jgi:hypothetical protein
MRKLDSNRKSRKRTICEIHRELYRELISHGYTEDSHCIHLLREVYPLGKKVVNKLRQHKHNFDNGWYEKNKTRGAPLRYIGSDEEYRAMTHGENENAE